MRRIFAPAKVNLFLHVGPLGPDGYHPLASLMVFGCFPRLLTQKISPSAQLIVDMVNPASNPATTAAVDLRK